MLEPRLLSPDSSAHDALCHTVHTAQFLSHIASTITSPTNHSVSLSDAILCTGLKKITIYLRPQALWYLAGNQGPGWLLICSSFVYPLCFSFCLLVAHAYVHSTNNVVKLLGWRVRSRRPQGRDTDLFIYLIQPECRLQVLFHSSAIVIKLCKRKLK